MAYRYFIGNHQYKELAYLGEQMKKYKYRVEGAGLEYVIVRLIGFKFRHCKTYIWNYQQQKRAVTILCENQTIIKIPNEGPTNIAVGSKLIVTSRSDVCPLEQETIGWAGDTLIGSQVGTWWWLG